MALLLIIVGGAASASPQNLDLTTQAQVERAYITLHKNAKQTKAPNKVLAGRNLVKFGNPKNGKKSTLPELRIEIHRMYWAFNPVSREQAEIENLVKEANEAPYGLNPATGNWHVNGPNYTLFEKVLDEPDTSCARTISGRETGGTYEHRVSYGFKWNAPGLGTAYGIGQALPASKMIPWTRPSSGLPIYKDPVGQIMWMKDYAVQHGYGSLCAAANHHLAVGTW